MLISIPYEISPQPDDRTCGATCLHSIYRFYGDEIPLPQLVDEVPQLINGGTLGVSLAVHALRRGYSAELYTYNLQVFDPSWFRRPTDIAAKLRRQLELKQWPRMKEATAVYLEFLELGGVVRFAELNDRLVHAPLKEGKPILTGLSATYLYETIREDPKTDESDDVGGEPVGHFVVLCGLDSAERSVTVADPLSTNPLAENQLYNVSLNRLIGAILLGIVTFDANLLVVSPKR